MVQTPEQYSFVYRCVLDDLRSGSLQRWAHNPVEVDGTVS